MATCIATRFLLYHLDRQLLLCTVWTALYWVWFGYVTLNDDLCNCCYISYDEQE